jgi:acyl carrier protein
LARYLPDGNIEFLGRLDNQVKVRGYRIELGEIESVLDQHRAIQTSVVAVLQDEPGNQRLVGYVIARPEESIDAAEVRRYLKHKLPDFMIPSALVQLDELPLTPSGKVNRKALPAPDRNRPELDESFATPRTPVEEILATIWAVILKLDKVGIHDNFFDLGGHSLLATQVVSRIRSVFSIEFPLRTLFESPTVAEMAAIIEQNRTKPASDSEVARMLGEVETMTDEEAEAAVKQLDREGKS